jgi:hypothetical protein
MLKFEFIDQGLEHKTQPNKKLQQLACGSMLYAFLNLPPLDLSE